MRRWLPIFLLCIACQAQYAPLAIDFEAPDSTAGTAYTTFLLNELPFLSGIAPGSTHALGLGQVYWSDLDNCSSTAPCVADNVAPCSTMGTNCYDWAAIDTDMMAYIGATVGVLGTFNNGCAGGRACKIILIINAEQDSGQGVTTVPTYVFSSTWAANTPGMTVPAARRGGMQGLARSRYGLLDHGPEICHVPALPVRAISPTVLRAWFGMLVYVHLSVPVPRVAAVCMGAFANMSGFPVVYEKPIQIAYQALISAIQLHYSSGGSGHGPTIAPYIAYIRIGMAAGGENNPGCVGVGAVSGGVLANTFWPGPKGLAAEPQCYTQCGYLTNWAGTAQNGLSCTNTAACTLDGLGSDGDGYVTAMDKFLGSLFSGSIRATTSSHGSRRETQLSPTPTLKLSPPQLSALVSGCSRQGSLTRVRTWSGCPQPKTGWSTSLDTPPQSTICRLSQMGERIRRRQTLASARLPVSARFAPSTVPEVLETIAVFITALRLRSAAILTTATTGSRLLQVPQTLVRLRSALPIARADLAAKFGLRTTGRLSSRS